MFASLTPAVFERAQKYTTFLPGGGRCPPVK